MTLLPLIAIGILLGYFVFQDRHTFRPLQANETQFTPEEQAYLRMYTDLFRDKKIQSDLELISGLVKYVGLRLDPFKGDAECCDFNDRIQVMRDSFSGKITVYCTHYAIIYSLMANDLGLQTRLVHFRPRDPNYQHVVAESYVKEFDEWVMVDPTYDHHYFIHVSDNTVDYLDTAEAIVFFSDNDVFSLPENESLMVKTGNRLMNVKSLSNNQMANLEEQIIYLKNQKGTHPFYD